MTFLKIRHSYHFSFRMSFVMDNETNWDQFLETPPGWIFTYNDQENQRFITEENDILAQLQPSTFDFLNDDDDVDITKKIEGKLQSMEHMFSNYMVLLQIQLNLSMFIVKYQVDA